MPDDKFDQSSADFDADEIRKAFDQVCAQVGVRPNFIVASPRMMQSPKMLAVLHQLSQEGVAVSFPLADRVED
jgi:alcohol dehydrogenase class IV